MRNRLLVLWFIVLLPALSPAADTLWDRREIPITGKAEPKLKSLDEFMIGFVRKHDVPGATMAVARNGKIVYARGFGYSDVDGKIPVDPDALFRIASISKPFTSVAIQQLRERDKLSEKTFPFEYLHFQPFLETDTQPDGRLKSITLHHLLRHTGGFDRGASFDPMFRSISIAKTLGTRPPAGPNEIIRYVAGRKLDFDPGTKEAYSNFGYCVLGRVVEQASGMSYEQYVKKDVLAPLGITRMRIGRSLATGRLDGEVHYYPSRDVKVTSVFDPNAKVPVAYGGWYLEAMDSHGGWIASAPELVRFASSLADAKHCPILKEGSIQSMLTRSEDTGYDKEHKPKAAFYADGWLVRPIGDRVTFWHNGLLDGTSTLLVHRSDGLTWAVLFNADRAGLLGKTLSELVDPQIHPVVSEIKEWPQGWDFREPTARVVR